jgi:acyl-CoA synthetase (AMP-forming)/AMP-acid ligase II
MTTLCQALLRRAADEILWIGAGGACSVRTARARAAALARRLPGGCLALAFSDDERLAVALLAAEGNGAKMLLVPASWDQAVYADYARRAGVDALVTDRPEFFAEGVVAVTAWAEGDDHSEDAPAAGARWIIPTSGTTGLPKLVEHDLESLARTVKTDPAKGAALTWGLVYELARFAGLQVFLQALLGGSRIVFVDRAAPMDRIAASLAYAGCNALSATPTFWRMLSMTPGAGLLPMRLITLGGESADALVLRKLRALFPEAKIVHIYASTEAGVGFSVTDGAAGFPAAYLDRPPPGINLQVDPEGMLWLRPGRASARFIGESAALAGADGWIRTGDLVRREGDRFVFLGRANGAINVGGNKVFPEEVEDCIRAVEGVAMALVRARPNPIIGSVVEARVQPASGCDRDTLKQRILQACRDSLAAYKVPALITWVDGLAVGGTGKLIRS